MSDEDTKMSDEEINEEPEAFGPAALGLHRVGTELPKKPRQATKPMQGK